MQHVSRVVLPLVACLSLAVPAESSAQFSAVVGGGATLPLADFADGLPGSLTSDGRPPASSTGWWLNMGALFGIGSTGLSAGGRGFWGQSGHDDSDIKSKLFGGFLVAEYALQIVPRLSPYVYGGIGRMVYNYDEQLTDSARMLGGGIAVDLNGPALRLDGSWISGTGETDGIEFVGIAATVRMPLGAG